MCLSLRRICVSNFRVYQCKSKRTMSATIELDCDLLIHVLSQVQDILFLWFLKISPAMSTPLPTMTSSTSSPATSVFTMTSTTSTSATSVLTLTPFRHCVACMRKCGLLSVGGDMWGVLTVPKNSRTLVMESYSNWSKSAARIKRHKWLIWKAVETRLSS